MGFISLSAGLYNTIREWPHQRQMGFSKLLAVGDSLDMEFDEVLFFVARDGKTRGIVVFVEHVRDGGGFEAAAPSPSRNKP
ncbi:hypothetical protein, partial [Enterobacter asburiae]